MANQPRSAMARGSEATSTLGERALNISEGSGSQGKNRNARYFNALGSALEVSTALQVAVAFGYVASVDDALFDDLNRIRATLYRVLHR